MKVRTQLVLACVLLSILPLSGIVLYSYQASRKALEAAYHREAARLAKQMDHRLDTIRTDLQQRLAEVSSLPLQNIPKGTTAPDAVVDNVLMALGESAPLIDSIEVQPMVVTPRPPREPAKVAPPATPERPQPQAAENDEAALPEPVVIDIPPEPKMPRFVMSDEQRQRLNAMAKLGAEMRLNRNTMSPAEMDAKGKQIDELSRQINAEMKQSQDAFQKQLQETLRARDERRKLLLQQRSALRKAQKDASKREGAADESDVDDDEAPVAKRAGAAPAPAPLAAPAPAPAPHAVAMPSARPAANPAAAAQAPQLGVRYRVVQGTPATPSVTDVAEGTVVMRRKVSAAEAAALHERAKRIALLFGNKFNVPVQKNGAVIAQISAQVKPEAVISRVLGTATDENEVAFAADREGHIYTRNPDDRQMLDRLGVTASLTTDKPLPKLDNWIVASSKDPQTGLRIGVARPVGDNLDDLRRTAAYNFTAGVALIFIALIGMVPVANHITRDVQMVTVGAERIAAGDLTTRLPVKSHNEFGQLATAFNKMAHDLSHHQETILVQERTRKEQEMQQRLLELEYGRKSVELEDARRFQLSMLPKEVPCHPNFEVAAFIQTATEVGGDYYDFHYVPGQPLSVTVGDATGHGAKAGTMVTVVKTLFAGYEAAVPPSRFLAESAEKIKRMELGRMAMSLLLARFEPQRLTIAAAGMPPALLHRKKSNQVEEIAFSATPLGTLGTDYSERIVDLERGDTILLLTDGFPELLDEAGQQLGYAAVLDAFATAATAPTADAVIAAINATARAWHGDLPPNDDVTFVVVRVA
jgi:serine phosphatase RsbU (regulator of sigma subunit)